jgi:hypothetical protein
MLRALLVVWSTACLAVIGLTLLGYEPGPKADAGEFFLWAMLALTFPAGLLAVVAFAGVVAINEGSQWDMLALVPNSAGFALLWAALVLAGYMQWFKVFPALLKKISAMRSPL